MLPALEQLLHRAAGASGPLSVKWKVAAAADGQERALLELLLEKLPANTRLRLDANGGWSRATAWGWAERLAGEARLQWLEQPLASHDQAGLEALAARLPVALDESLRASPALVAWWPGWQVRRPLLEGDPRPLLAALAAGQPHWMVSTALETGIGRRWVHHLAALQALGPTPTAPGLAPGWCPRGDLFSADPQLVWQAAA
jgi:O-succinylbenzoate synthase